MKSAYSWLFVLAFLSACDKADGTIPTSSPTPSAAPVAKAPEVAANETAAPTPAPAAAAPTCPDGFYAHATPGFCIKLPEGVSAGTEDANAGTLNFITGDQFSNLHVGWSEQTMDEAVSDGKASATNLKGKFEDKGDLSNGRKWFRFTNETVKGFEHFTLKIIVPRPKGTLRCEVDGEMKKEKEPIFAKLLDACKTLESR